MSNAPNILEIMQIASGYRAAKVLLSAVELKLFSLLGSSELTADDIASQVALIQRHDQQKRRDGYDHTQ